jgi:hypothetical protein
MASQIDEASCLGLAHNSIPQFTFAGWKELVPCNKGLMSIDLPFYLPAEAA